MDSGYPVSFSSCHYRASLRRDVDSLQQAIPGTEPVSPVVFPSVDIGAVPHFGRGAPIQALVWTDKVVPGPELGQAAVQCFSIRHQPVIQSIFQGSPKALDPAVHPRAVELGGLMPDAEQLQSKPKQSGSEDCLVVGTDGFRRAEAIDGIQQHAEDGNAGFAFQRLKRQIDPAAVIDQAEDHEAVKP